MPRFDTSGNPTLRISKLLCLTFLFLIEILSPSLVYGLDVTLVWNANSEQDIGGYRIFYRQEGRPYDYNNPAWEASIDELQDPEDPGCTIENLDENTKYHFVARAFDTSGNESADSEEVTYTPPQNTSPTANAGPNQTVNEGVTVTLDGSNSGDPDGSIVSYLWTQTAGTIVGLSNRGKSVTVWVTYLYFELQSSQGEL